MQSSRGIKACCLKECQICFQKIVGKGLSIEHTNAQGLLSESSVCYCIECWEQYNSSTCPHCRQDVFGPLLHVHEIDCGRQLVQIQVGSTGTFYATETTTVRDVLYGLSVHVYMRLSFGPRLLYELDHTLLELGVLQEPHATLEFVDLHDKMISAMYTGDQTQFRLIVRHMEPTMDSDVLTNICRLVFDENSLDLLYIGASPNMHTNLRDIAFISTLGYIIRIRTSLKSGEPVWLQSIEAGLRGHQLMDLNRIMLPFFGFEPDEILTGGVGTVRDRYESIHQMDWSPNDLFQCVCAMSEHTAMYIQIDYHRKERLDYFVRFFTLIITTHQGTIAFTDRSHHVNNDADFTVSSAPDSMMMVTTITGERYRSTPINCVLYIMRESQPSLLSFVIHDCPRPIPEADQYRDPTTFLSIYNNDLHGYFGPRFIAFHENS